MDVDTDEDEHVPLELRICKQCSSGTAILLCSCEDSSTFRSIRQVMGTKRSTPDQWFDSLLKLEEYCQLKRQKLQHAPPTHAGTGVFAKSEEEAISSSRLGDTRGGSSKVPEEAISSGHPGASSSPDGAIPGPKAKAKPRQSFSDIVFASRDFDATELGDKYASIGPSTLSSIPIRV